MAILHISGNKLIPERIDLAERIVRLYLTHPGVTADGIMGKMGIWAIYINKYPS